jgi:hypothetical protein
MRTFSFLLGLVVFLTSACKSAEPSPGETIVLFDKAFADFGKSGQGVARRDAGANEVHYFMPASAVALINQGNRALPALHSKEASTDQDEAQFAKACAEIIEAKDFDVGEHFISSQGNVEMVAYTTYGKRR